MQIDRILIVGLGSIGGRHLRLARLHFPYADIRVLRHQISSTIPEFSNGCFFSLQEAISFLPQMAVIANPASHHLYSARALAEIGSHLLIEKPLSINTKGVVELIQVCEKKNIVLLIGYNLRYLPSLRYFRQLINADIIGRVLSVRCEVGHYLPTWRPGVDYRLTVSGKHVLGGGILLELSHELDYLRWIFGEVHWVSAVLSTQSDLEIDVEDSAHITLGFVPPLKRKAIIGVLNMDFIRHDNTRICTAIGEKGSLRWDGISGEVQLYETDSTIWRPLLKYKNLRDDSYLEEWKNFKECILNRGKPLISGDDGLKVLQIIEATKNSSNEDGRRTLIESAVIAAKVES